MGEEILRDCDILVGGYDFTTQHNEVTVALGRESKDKSTFRGKTRIYKPGLKTVAFTTRFLWDASDDAGPPQHVPIDDQFWDQIDDAGAPLSVWPRGAEEAKVGYAAVIAKEGYNFLGAHGELITGEMSAGPADELLHPSSLVFGTKTATGNGSGIQLGAVSTTQRVMAFLHVLEASGTAPTLDVTVESDDADTFLSPATRFTFAQKTARGFEVLPFLNGPITDTWWRATWAIGGTTPSFKLLVGLYIGPQHA